ncbi:hypothetical protein Ancab_028678 [Ancistrocladus abbreviatus]
MLGRAYPSKMITNTPIMSGPTIGPQNVGHFATGPITLKSFSLCRRWEFFPGGGSLNERRGVRVGLDLVDIWGRNLELINCNSFFFFEIIRVSFFGRGIELDVLDIVVHIPLD